MTSQAKAKAQIQALAREIDLAMDRIRGLLQIQSSPNPRRIVSARGACWSAREAYWSAWHDLPYSIRVALYREDQSGHWTPCSPRAASPRPTMAEALEDARDIREAWQAQQETYASHERGVWG